MPHAGTTSLTIGELREFASFTPAEQRYIRRSLDVGLGRRDAMALWARDDDERASIHGQYIVYQDIATLRALRPDETGLSDVAPFLGKLLRMAAYDLSQERLLSFSAFRFLYERLLGAWARPWLPGAFCGAAALPQIPPDRRRTLLHSISEAAATAPAWSDHEPRFYPEFIEKEVV